LIARARKRFDSYVQLHRQAREQIDEGVRVAFSFAIVPMFPGIAPLTIQELGASLSQCRLRATGTEFPRGNLKSLHEGFFYDHPNVEIYFEANTHRLLFYAEEIEPFKLNRRRRRRRQEVSPQAEELVVRTNEILALVILWLGYSKVFYRSVGFDGSLKIEVGLSRIQGQQFIIPIDLMWGETIDFSPRLDDDLRFSMETSALEISQNSLDIAKHIYRTLCFACGWEDAFSDSDEVVDQQIDKALEYLGWQRENP
jgi:hypothetical protein